MTNRTTFLMGFGIGAFLGSVISIYIYKKQLEIHQEVVQEEEPDIPAPVAEIEDININEKIRVDFLKYLKETKPYSILEKPVNSPPKEPPVFYDPFLISIEEFSETRPEFSKINLYYYKEDDVLCDEEEVVIYNPNDIIGEEAMDELKHSSTIWVRAEKTSTDYEITTLNHSYKELVLGEMPESLTDEAIKKNKKRNRRK